MIEQTAVFGRSQHLVGTLTVPLSRPTQPSLTVLMTNAGVISRVGPHRINVRLARALARLGVPSLRFDLSGLGDSGRPHSQLPAAQQFIADTRDAMDWCESRLGARRFLMIGFCSGADIGHQAALVDERLAALVMHDAYVYSTRRARANRVLYWLRRHGLAALARRGLDRLRGRRDPASQAVSVGPDGPVIFGRARIPARAEFGDRLDALTARGVKMLLIYSGGAPAWYNYPRQFADAFADRRFIAQVAHDYMPDNDHTLTRLRAQQSVIDRITGWMRDERLLSD